jgi:hypothetical protein
MINADRLICKIDEFHAIQAEIEKYLSADAVQQFDFAIKVLESHREDIENAGKVLKHWGMRVFPCKVYRPHLYGDQQQRAEFMYDELDGGRLRCGYATGSGPKVGWLSDGSIKIGCNWAMKTDDVRDGIMHGIHDKVVDVYDVSYQQVVKALVTLARLYPEMEKDFVNYFETLGQ